MWQAFRALFEFLGFIEKAIPSDALRESRHEIKKPKLSKKVQEWLENEWKKDAHAKLRALNIEHGRRITKKVKQIIEWGGEPVFMEVQEDGYLLFKYVRDGLEGSERIRLQ